MIKEIKLPEISETVESGDVIEIFVSVGDSVELEQPLVQLETEKATFDVPSPETGQIVEIVIKPGQTVNIGQVLMKVETEAAGRKVEPTKPSTGKTDQRSSEPQRNEDQKPASSQKDTGTDAAAGVQKKTDDKAKPKTQSTGTDAGSPTPPGISAQQIKGTSARALPDFNVWGKVERKAVSTTRKKIADTLSYTWATVPQVTQYDQADVTKLEDFRRRCSQRVKDAGGKLTLTAIVLKAAAVVLREFPEFNASFDPETNEIIYKHYYHLCVAVDTDRGLLVPVIRDVDQKSLLQVAVEVSTLAERTRDHKVTPDEMVGGNFTVTNLGGLGGGPFAPIIYWPQTAILGISRAAQQPVWIDGAVQPRLIVPLSLSYDHRIIDGAQGVRFLRRLVELLENPWLLALE